MDTSCHIEIQQTGYSNEDLVICIDADVVREEIFMHMSTSDICEKLRDTCGLEEILSILYDGPGALSTMANFVISEMTALKDLSECTP